MGAIAHGNAASGGVEPRAGLAGAMMSYYLSLATIEIWLLCSHRFCSSVISSPACPGRHRSASVSRAACTNGKRLNAHLDQPPHTAPCIQPHPRCNLLCLAQHIRCPPTHHLVHQARLKCLLWREPMPFQSDFSLQSVVPYLGSQYRCKRQRPNATKRHLIPSASHLQPSRTYLVHAQPYIPFAAIGDHSVITRQR